MLRGALLTSDMFVPHVPLHSHHWLGFMLRANRTQCCHSRKKTLAEERLLVLCDVVVMVLPSYRAGGLLNPRVDLESCGADVLKAKELGFGHGPELAHTSGFGRFFQQDLGTAHHLDVMDLHVSIEQLFLTKVLQPLRFDEGRSAARSAITDGPAFGIVAWLGGAQTQLISAGEKKESNRHKKQRQVPDSTKTSPLFHPSIFHF